MSSKSLLAIIGPFVGPLMGPMIGIGLLAGSGLHAEDGRIHRCVDAAGNISFSDYPCPADSRADGVLPLEPRPAATGTQTAGISQLCTAGGALQPSASLDGDRRATLPPAQQQALQQALAVLSEAGARDWRWRSGEQDALHLCARDRRGETLELVASESGAVVAFRRGVGAYLNDPETPAGLRERCAALVTDCYDPPHTSIDSCVHLSRSCSAVPPWTESEACCPQRCKDDYARRRGAESAEDPLQLFLSVLNAAPACIVEGG